MKHIIRRHSIFSFLSTVIASVLAMTLSYSALAADTKTIKIGTSIPLTGATEFAGKAMQHGTLAAFEAANKAGTIPGVKLELVALDDGYDPKRTIENAKILHEKEKVFAFLNVFGAPTVAAILPYIEKEDIPMIGPLSAANLGVPARKNVFMVRPNAEMEAETLVAFLVDKKGIKDIALFYQDDVYGKSGLTGVNQALTKRNLRLLASGAYPRNTDEVDKALEAISPKKPKAIIMVGVYPATASFVKKYVAKEPGVVIAGAASVALPIFFDATKDLKFDFFSSSVTPLTTDTSLDLPKNLERDMKAAGFSDINQYSMEAYVAAQIMIEALKKGGAASHDALRDALNGMSSLNIGGLKVSYSSTNHQGLKEPFMAHYEGGKLSPVK